MLRIVTLLLLCCLCSFAFAKGSHGHSSGSHSSKASKSGKPSKAKKAKGGSAEKTVHVSGYTRKDGKYVAPYYRRPPGTAGIGSTSESGSISSHTYRRDYLAEGITPHPSVQYDKHGRIKRSHAAKAAFAREHPCPATGKSTGRCPGYVVDHVQALECGGPDEPTNMQWQTTADAKAKDKTERQCRL